MKNGNVQQTVIDGVQSADQEEKVMSGPKQ
jgi:hypothetical protein